MGTSNTEPQEYSRNIVEYKDPGKYIFIIFLLYLGVPCLGFLLEPFETLSPKPYSPRSGKPRSLAMQSLTSRKGGLGFPKP